MLFVGLDEHLVDRKLMPGVRNTLLLVNYSLKRSDRLIPAKSTLHY